MMLSFFGAVETVTGSKYLLETSAGKKILIDCGLFQGLKELRLRNREPFPLEPHTIDGMVLTHAHLDHSGYIPALVRDGFGQAIHSSKVTRDLSEIILQDSGYLQEEEARYANKRGYSKHRPALPLYTARDAKNSLASFRTHDFGVEFPVVEGVSASLTRAGHILGASSVLIQGDGKRVLFSGDLGRENDPILKDPEPPPAADYVLIESTYGNRTHPVESAKERLGTIIRETANRGGVVLIPAFAVGRAQLLLSYLHSLKAEGAIPDVPVYLNSPMSINVTELFCDNRVEHKLSPEVCHLVCGVAKYVRTVDESKALNEKKGPMVIISANGMISGGRILHHIAEFGPKESTTIILPGYQAVGTRGRSLFQGAKTLRIFGADVSIRARVESIDGLSAHADSNGLIAWLKRIPAPPKKVFVTHGEPDAAEALCKRIHEELGFACEVPRMNQKVALV